MSLRTVRVNAHAVVILAAGALVLFCVMLAYGGLLHVSFVYDDWHELRRALDYSPLSYIANTVDVRQPQYFYRPTARLFFYLEYALFGRQATGWHLLSLLIHSGSSIMWGLLLFVLSGRRSVAIIAACAYAVFPAISETVFWISDTAMLLGVFFGVLCLLFWTRFLTTRSARYVWAALACLALSLLSKESMVVLAPIMAGVHWGLKRAQRAPGPLPYWSYVGLAVVLAGYLAADIYVLRHHVGIVGTVYAPGGHTLTNLRLYLSLLATPFHDWQIATTTAAARLVAFAILALLLWRKAGWIAGFLLLFPALAFLPYISWEGFTSRYAYLAALGSTGLAALALGSVWSWRGRLAYISRGLVLALCAVMLVAQIGDVRVRAGQWAHLTQSQEKILRDVQAQNVPMPAGTSLYFLNSPTRADYTIQMMNDMIDRGLRTSTVDLGPLPPATPGGASHVFYYQDGILKRLSFTGPLPSLQASHPLPLHFGSAISLIGYDVPSTVVQRGQSFLVLLYWAASAPADRRYTVFVHLIDGKDKVLAQLDSWPQGGRSPTDAWTKGQFVGDYYLLTVPDSTPPGEAWVELGLYDVTTMQRLSILDDAGKPLDQRVVIGPVTVR